MVRRCWDTIRGAGEETSSGGRTRRLRLKDGSTPANSRNQPADPSEGEPGNGAPADDGNRSRDRGSVASRLLAVGAGLISNDSNLASNIVAFFNLFIILAAICAIMGFIRLTNPR